MDGTRAILSACVEAACREVLPPELHGLAARAKDAVRPAASSWVGCDFETRAASTAFQRLRRGGPGGVEFMTVSELGLERLRRFADARELAQALIDHLPTEARHTIADARATDDGRIRFCSRAHSARLRASGLLHCAACGIFCAGERGLRDHQLVKHGRTYEDAMEVVHVSRTQLIPYAAAPAARLFAAAAAAAHGAACVADSAVVARRDAALERRAPSARAALSLEPGLAAARDGDVAALRALVRTGGWDARAAVDVHGSLALHWAAGGGHLAACRFLVDECGVDACSAQQRDGRCALHWAARNGHLDVCRWLVGERAVPPDTPTRDGTVALHWAVWQGRWAVVRWLVETAGADLHATNAYGCNAIQWAAQSGDVRMCAWLRAAGLDVGLLNRNGHSALHKAAIKGHARVCAWLLADAGLGLRHVQPDEGGHTPARMAACDGHAELAIWLEAEQARLRVRANAARPQPQPEPDGEDGLTCRQICSEIS
ncbi:hypothetical protein KFE25_003739 [Diacronema lutheri]|uniref:C2H2-type domain-containing protein n=1 Tax=Diacronema lutheri TaxID=2081491 RepID=A0A8J5X9T1_DIALT|nr:hypothetical protein KFE25_003739 [Diacronema lutheri]